MFVILQILMSVPAIHVFMEQHVLMEATNLCVIVLLDTLAQYVKKVKLIID